jgi:hypothetical protein
MSAAICWSLDFLEHATSKLTVTRKKQMAVRRMALSNNPLYASATARIATLDSSTGAAMPTGRTGREICIEKEINEGVGSALTRE